MYSQHATLSTFSLISLFLTATYFSKVQYSLFVLKVPLNLNQSINQSWADWAAWLPGTFQVGRLVHYPCK